ncbi:hypothetical protein RND71_022961 [Anisodus tanguticus]|uniref:Uncharacterized protein n=1 Tax=Anisodus tanguticus TaxID=243964 RepID=A0AAE1RUN1_9SOLA|nr:hypothetical protein RND71_022961 [Anisodus tanguticus]
MSLEERQARFHIVPPLFGLKPNLAEMINGRKAKEKAEEIHEPGPYLVNTTKQVPHVMENNREDQDDTSYKDCEEDLYMVNTYGDYVHSASDDEHMKSEDHH